MLLLFMLSLQFAGASATFAGFGVTRPSIVAAFNGESCPQPNSGRRRKHDNVQLHLSLPACPRLRRTWLT